MRGKTYSYTASDLTQAVLDSISYAEVKRRLGLKQHGNDSLRAHIERLGLDTSHFQAYRTPEKYSLDTILVENAELTASELGLKKKLLKAGLLQYLCLWCGISEWREQPLVLQLDHENGDPYDNRLNNLRLLCPNCHSQTPTFCGKAKNTGRPRGAKSRRGREG